MRRSIWLLILMLLAASSAPAGEETLVLDERVCFRHYYQRDWDIISPGPLKTDGEKLLGKRGMARLKRDVRRRLEHLKLDWDKLDWRDRAAVRFVCPNASMYFSQWSMLSPGLQAAFLCFRFVVDDPAKVRTLTLEAEHIGGIRVFVNGREIIRGHLPEGEISDETVAGSYGNDAYFKLFPEVQEKYRKRWRRKNPGVSPPKYYGFANWEMPVGSRIYKARNRTLGPAEIPASALRAGTNVLAIEIRSAALNPIALGRRGYGGGGG